MEVAASRAATASHFGTAHHATAPHFTAGFCAPAESVVIAMPSLVAVPESVIIVVPESAIIVVPESMIIVAEFPSRLDINTVAVTEMLEALMVVKIPMNPAPAAIELGMGVIIVIPGTGANEHVSHKPFGTPIAVGRAAKWIVRVITVRAHRWIMIKAVSRPYLNADGNLGMRLHRWNRQ